MAASGILLCGIAEAVRPEVDLSVGVPADKVVIADGILDPVSYTHLTLPTIA